MKVATNTAKLLRNVPLPDETAVVHDNAVVLDIGSCTTRIGFSGDDAPRLEGPSVVGKAADGSPHFLKKAYNQREHLEITNVMEKGLVTNWDAMEHMLGHVNDLLSISKDPNTPLLLAEAALVPKEQREQLVKILFEKVGVNSLYIGMAPVLSLYACGKTCGMVVEMGHGTCHTVPIFEGFGLFHSILQMDFGGDDLTTRMGEIVAQGGHQFPKHHERDIWQYLKECHCSVAVDRGSYATSISEANRNDIVHHTLPDNTVISMGPQRHTLCESIFDPVIITNDQTSKGLHTLALDSVRKCDQDVAPLLFGNVVLSGGHSLFSGLPDRLNRELQDLAPTEKVRISALTERRQSAFVGGSILASLPTFQDLWVKRSDYEEIGEAVCHRNCF